MTVRFTNRAFERSHGRSPRGFGSWAFQATERLAAFDDDLVGEPVFFTGTLTDAKAQLVATGVEGTWAVLP